MTVLRKVLQDLVKVVCANPDRPQHISFGCSPEAFQVLASAGGKEGRQPHSASSSIAYVKLTIGWTEIEAQKSVEPTKAEAAACLGRAPVGGGRHDSGVAS